MKVVIGILLAVSIINWIKWRTATFALIYYNEKNRYERPSKEEMRECIGFVIKHSIKDIAGH